MTILNSQGNDWLDMLATANSLVKAIAFFLIWIIIWLPVGIPLARQLKWNPLQPLTIKQKLPLLGSLYLIAPLIIWIFTKSEGVSFSAYGLEWQPAILLSLILGLGLGLTGLILIFGAQSLLGWIIWHPENRIGLWSIVLPILGLGLWVGWTEELIFRGFLINELEQDFSFWTSAVISSSLFALLHLIWEQKQTIPQLPGLWLMGMVLAGARVVDGGSLGLAWGLHVAWIWGLSSLDSAQLMDYNGKGANWITGLGQQPLAGLAGIFCLLSTGAVLWYFSQVLGI